jgi:hypothetical protein
VIPESNNLIQGQDNQRGARQYPGWFMPILRRTKGAVDEVSTGEADVPVLDASARAALTVRESLLLVLISFSAAIAFYMPFWLKVPSFAGIPFNQQGMERINLMWDGPLFIVAAATLWDPNPIHPLYGTLASKPIDYAERFPIYPLAIRLLSPLWGYWNAGLVINVVLSTTATLFLYAFLRRFSSVPSAAFWVALVSIFWPPRGFLYRYVVMSDPAFILGL